MDCSDGKLAPGVYLGCYLTPMRRKIKAKQVLDLDSVNHVKLNLAELLTWMNLLLTVQYMLPSPEGCLKRTWTTVAIVESSRHTFSSALVISVLEVLKVNIKSTGRTSPWEPESSAFQFQPYKWCSKEGESAYPFSHIISRGFNPAESCNSMSTITVIVLDAVQRPDAWRRCPSALVYLCKDTKTM